jgi:predicted PurR-regulated permease PerM
VTTSSVDRKLAPETDEMHNPRKVGLWIGGAFIAYLAWLLILPFVPALAFAFALAMLGHPLSRWIETKLRRRNAAALVTVIVICLSLVLPITFLAQVLIQEASQGLGAMSSDVGRLRDSLERSEYFGALLRWLDSRIDLPQEASQVARSLTQWLSTGTSSAIRSSAWAITQIATTVVVLFYFLRDQDSLLTNLRSVIPMEDDETDRLFARITETIRISLYGKLVVAAIQGGLGGLIFWWLDIPGPAFWGFVMALFSVLPVLGAFVIWVPAALALAMQGYWGRALFLTGWGILIVHPVDNLLGPVLVGTKLRVHTLLTFFSVIGGLAAFGAAGIVLGPVIVAIGISLFETQQRHRLLIATTVRRTEQGRSDDQVGARIYKEE